MLGGESYACRRYQDRAARRDQTNTCSLCSASPGSSVRAGCTSRPRGMNSPTRHSHLLPRSKNTLVWAQVDPPSPDPCPLGGTRQSTRQTRWKAVCCWPTGQAVASLVGSLGPDEWEGVVPFGCF